MTLSSQSQRSSSMRGIPEDILAMLRGGWRSSPSINAKWNCVEMALPIVDLPQPVGPAIMKTGMSSDESSVFFGYSLFSIVQNC